MDAQWKQLVAIMTGVSIRDLTQCICLCRKQIGPIKGDFLEGGGGGGEEEGGGGGGGRGGK